MKIGLILECGPDGPDQHVCKRLISLLLPDAEVSFTTLINKPRLLRECGPSAASHFKEGCDRVLIMWDLYPAWREGGEKPCRYQDRAAILHSLEAAQVDAASVSLICIHEELEAWLLADGRALSACFSTKNRPVTIGDHKNPERISNPKGKLSQIIRENKCGQKYEDHIHAKKIAEHITDWTRLRRCETFRRFAKKVADIDL